MVFFEDIIAAIQKRFTEVQEMKRTDSMTENVEETGQYGYVAADSVNFRKEPTTQSERITRIKRYGLFVVIGKVGNDDMGWWYHINFNGSEGYVQAWYVKIMDDDMKEAFLQSEEYEEGIKNNAP